MAEDWEAVEFNFPHLIKNTSPNGRSLAEHLLDASRRPQTLSQGKEDACIPGWGTEGRRGSHIWDALPLVGRHAGTEGHFGAWRRVQQPGCGRQDRVRLAQMVGATALHAPASDTAGADGGWHCGI